MEGTPPAIVPGQPQAAPPVERNLFLRSFIALLWFMLLYFTSNIIVGMVIGAVAGAGTTSFAEGAAAGRAAALAFFQRFGVLMLLAQVFATFLLVLSELLPGTSKMR